jgi:hypothetical protein
METGDEWAVGDPMGNDSLVNGGGLQDVSGSDSVDGPKVTLPVDCLLLFLLSIGGLSGSCI